MPLRLTARGEELARLARLDGQGVSDETTLPTDWAPDRNIAWKTAIPGRGHSSPIVWGTRVFLTTAIEGDVLPGAKAPIHYIEEDPKKGPQEFLHPDSLGADRKHTLEVMALDLEHAARCCGSASPTRARSSTTATRPGATPRRRR